jgi:ornithine cyclodeaminase/alanine dehydrogenase-like protein (mu-crystallin family)
MAKAVLRLDADDIWRTLEAFDPVAVLAEDLIKRAINHPDQEQAPALPLVPCPAPEADHLLAEDASLEVSCAMPAPALRMVHTGALAALATRKLLPPGGITVAMLGTRYDTQSQLAVLARHVPDIVHVAMHFTDGDHRTRLDPRLLDQLDLMGIGLSVQPGLADSLFGANLVVAASEDALTEGTEGATINHLVRGTVLVNASGADLPADVVDNADQVYVDDLTLLQAHAGRHVVARHLAQSAAGRLWSGGRPPTIAADLGLLLAGARPGREQQDDIVVVELLSARTPNTRLAHMIAHAATRGGLGERVTT